MAANRNTIEGWIKQGQDNKSTHVIIVCDTYDYDDYPVFVSTEQDVREVIKNLGSMQRVVEVYNLALPVDTQLAECRAYHT